MVIVKGFALVYSITTNSSLAATAKIRNQILRIKEDANEVGRLLDALKYLSLMLCFEGSFNVGW